MVTKPNYPDKPDQNDDNGCNDCRDKDNATQVSITSNRKELCKLLYSSVGNVSKAETKFTGEYEIYKEKKCIFLNTEESYRRYRNFDIVVGNELNQTNISLKANITQLKDWNKSLSSTLTTISKQMKDLKTKFLDLKDAACRLDSSYTDKCNIAQKKTLTGKVPEHCPEPAPPIDACKDAETQIEDLICRPKGLLKDIDYIFQASADVVGIQIFSNVDTLDQLQTDLTSKSTSFEKLVNDAMKARKSELDTLQQDLVSSVKAITQAAVTRNSERAKFEGYYDAAEFLCCPSCDCVPCDDEEDHDHEHDHDDRHHGNYGNQKQDDDHRKGEGCNDDQCQPRLKECGEAICEICDEVKTTFCCDEKVPEPLPPAKPTPPRKSAM
jgi:hypothetical protein